MDDSDWHAVHRIEAAARQAERASYRIEEAAQRIGVLLEYGYDGNGLRLIELLEAQHDSTDSTQSGRT